MWSDLAIYVGIAILLIIIFLVSELLKNEKVKEKMEKIIESIKDFFNFPF